MNPFTQDDNPRSEGRGLWLGAMLGGGRSGQFGAWSSFFASKPRTIKSRRMSVSCNSRGDARQIASTASHCSGVRVTDFLIVVFFAPAMGRTLSEVPSIVNSLRAVGVALPNFLYYNLRSSELQRCARQSGLRGWFSLEMPR